MPLSYLIGISQKRVVDEGLLGKVRYEHAAILQCLDGLARCKNPKRHPEEPGFTWCDAPNLIEENPMSFNPNASQGHKRNALSTIIKELREHKLLETIRGGKGNVLWFRITEKGHSILPARSKSEQNHDASIMENMTPHIEEPITKEQIPPNPQGGRDSELILRIQKLFKPDRTAPFPFNKREHLAYTENLATIESTSPEEWEALERWFKVPCDDSRAKWRTQSPLSLLGSWERQIKRAFDDLEKHPAPQPRRKRLEPPDGWQALYAEIMGYECPDQMQWERLPDDLQNQISTHPAP